MKTRIFIRDVHHLNQRQYEQCKSLTLRGRGSMQFYVRRLHQRSVTGQGHAVMLWNIADDYLIGWSLVWNEYSSSVPTAHFYIRADHRRMGYGSRLVRAVHKRFGEVFVLPWDSRSGNFFMAHKEIVDYNEFNMKDALNNDVG